VTIGACGDKVAFLTFAGAFEAVVRVAAAAGMVGTRVADCAAGTGNDHEGRTRCLRRGTITLGARALLGVDYGTAGTVVLVVALSNILLLVNSGLVTGGGRTSADAAVAASHGCGNGSGLWLRWGWDVCKMVRGRSVGIIRAVESVG
jgi:hypothetical protein